MLRKALIIFTLLITTTTMYSNPMSIDYAEITNRVNKIRRSVGAMSIESNIDLVNLAKLQVEAMIEQDKTAHNLAPESEKRELKLKLSETFNGNKSYVTIRIWELYATLYVNPSIKGEVIIPHVYDTSSRHFSVLTDINAEAMGWYVEEKDGLYWISTYVLMRYYQ